MSRALVEANRHPDTPGEFIDPGDGDALYVFWLRHDQAGATGAAFAAVSIRCRNEIGRRKHRPFATVNALVRPAIDCLRREVVARREITELQSTLAEHDGDLEMLLDVAGNGADGREDGGDDLKAIVASAAEHIDVGLAVLIVPEKNLVLVQPSGNEPLDAGLIARAHRHLLSTAQTRREAVIENSIRLHAAEDAPPYRILSCPVARSDGSTIGVLAMFRSSKRPEFNQRHTRLIELIARRLGAIIAGNYDPTTGLLTRAPFERRVRQALESAPQRPAGWSALYIDVNRMHVINDTHGMHTGDKVLARHRRAAAPAHASGRHRRTHLRRPLRGAVACRHRDGRPLRRIGAHRCRAARAAGATKPRCPSRVSIGVAKVECGATDYIAAFAPAETACKAANDRGRNRVELFQRSDESIIRRYRDISVAGEVRDAIAEGTAAPVRAAAGAAGRRPSRPALRDPAAHDRRQGPDGRPEHLPLRRAALPDDAGDRSRGDRPGAGHAGAPARPGWKRTRWSSRSTSPASRCRMPISAASLPRPSRSSGVRPEFIAFELTESAAVGNIGRAEVLIRTLRQMGCGVALDDFGTGLSSLSYLRSLPINMLKIDGSFVRDVLTDSKAESMIEAVAYLARSMNLVTVAEYVETAEIRERVAHLGVDYGQGYAIGRPTPLAEVLDQLGMHTTFARLDSGHGRDAVDGRVIVSTCGSHHHEITDNLAVRRRRHRAGAAAVHARGRSARAARCSDRR